MGEYKITFLSGWNQKESEVSMRRRFFRNFKARIPRKLKKAARYGIERRVYPTTQETETAYGHVYFHDERIEFAIIGRQTKWKVKARLACIKELKRQLACNWYV